MEKYSKAKQAQRELAAYIKDHFELTWQEIAVNQQVSYSQVSKVARLFGLQRHIQSKYNNVDAQQEVL
jgi:hypothetical protein